MREVSLRELLLPLLEELLTVKKKKGNTGFSHFHKSLKVLRLHF